MIGWSKRKEIQKSLGIFRLYFTKKNNAEILVTMRFDDFMKIYKEFDAAHFF
mgnify:CR=1 FL=1